MPATDDSGLSTQDSALSESPWLRFTVVFVSRRDPEHVLGAEWIELLAHQLADPAFLRDELRSQCERRGPGLATARAVMLRGQYWEAQACAALAAGVEIVGDSL